MPLTQVPNSMLSPDLQGATFGFKNRIINGAMMIDQRNAYAAINLATGGNYAADRFVLNKGTAAATVAAQVQSASLANFEKCLVWNTSTGSAPASGDVNGIWQAIEGLNVSDFQFGTANAQTFTVSFWLKCTSTGQIGVQLANGAVNRSYVTTITVAAANTWAQYSITVAGDTSGTWAKDNTTGLYVVLDMGSGTSYDTSTTNAWQAGNLKRTSACLKPVGTTGTIVYLTGVQLEKGSTATSFDYRPYGTELMLCYRYFQAFRPSSAYTKYGLGIGNSSTTIYAVTIAPKATMRAAPSLSATNCYGNDGNSNLGPVSALNNLSSPDGITFDCTIPSGGIAGRPVTFGDAGSINAVFTASAEL